jgi:hypothetical protein
MTTIGHNGGPAIIAHADNIDSLVDLANGIGAIKTPEQEAQATALLDNLRIAKKAADDKRIELKRPHDNAAAAVQAEWKPLLDKCTKAEAAVKDVLTPWRAALLAEQERQAKEARDAAQALLDEAQAKLCSDDLHEAIDGEAALKSATKLAAKANAISKQATGLRTSWEAQITDRRAALNHYLKANPEAFEALIQQLADSDARNAATRRDIPGVIFHERKKAA